MLDLTGSPVQVQAGATSSVVERREREAMMMPAKFVGGKLAAKPFRIRPKHMALIPDIASFFSLFSTFSFYSMTSWKCTSIKRTCPVIFCAFFGCQMQLFGCQH
jgi:hypothetical protein